MSSDILPGISAYLLTFYLAYLLTSYLAYHLAFYLEYLLTFYLAYLLTFYMAFCYLSGISSGMSSGILSVISSDILSGISSDILSVWHSLWHSIWLWFWPLRSGWGPVEVRRGPRRAESRRLRSGEAHGAQNLAGWRPARPTALRLAGWGPARSTAPRLSLVEVRRGHCNRELADEVRRGPLRSRAGRWGPARPTAIKSWQMRSGEAHCDQELANVRRGGRRRKEKEEGGRRVTDIKFNNPHLAGGEKSPNGNKKKQINNPPLFTSIQSQHFWFLIESNAASWFKSQDLTTIMRQMRHAVPLWFVAVWHCKGLLPRALRSQAPICPRHQAASSNHRTTLSKHL